MESKHATAEVPGLYRILPLKLLRKTQGVVFDSLPVERLGTIAAIDRVLHKGGAWSPGSVGDVDRPWYMHPHQIDNLLVMHGKRTVDLFSVQHGRTVTFEVTPEHILLDGESICDEPAILSWPFYVFHRVVSDATLGSASLNFAIREEGFDIVTNFNIYDLDTATGEYRVIREGRLDQPAGD